MKERNGRVKEGNSSYMRSVLIFSTPFPPPKKRGSICCILKKKIYSNNSILARSVLLGHPAGATALRCHLPCSEFLSLPRCPQTSSARQDFAIPFFKRKPTAEGTWLSCASLARRWPSGRGPRTATGQPRFSAGLQKPNLFGSGAVQRRGGGRDVTSEESGGP